MPTVTLSGTDITFDCEDGDTIMRAALRAGLGFSYDCNVGSCGNCRFQLISGEVVHAHAETLGEPPAWSERDLAKKRYLGCQAKPKGDVEIKVRLDEGCESLHRPRQLKGTLSEVSTITHDISEFRFTLDEPAAFLPGQYALLQIPGVTGERAYSMCNVPGGENRWDFQIRRVPDGAGTAALFDALKSGDTLRLDGPYGMGYLRTDSPRDIICMAGGSGLSPMVSIARAAALNPSLEGRKIHFLYGGRTPDDICGEDQLSDLPGWGTRLAYHGAVSEGGTDEGGTLYTGFVHDMALDLFGDTLADHEIYFAGPPLMGQAVQKLLFVDQKVPPEQVHFDQFY